MSESPQSAATTPGTSTRHVGVVLLIVLVSYFMIVLNNSIVFTGLAQLENELRLSAGELSWVQNAYTLLFGGLLLLGARAGDLLGRRRVFIAGLAVFGIASMLVGLAPDGVLLIAARAVQGVGAAIVAPASLALITATFPAGHARQRAIAAYGTTAGIGGSLGMVIGGVLASALSWRAGFFLSAVLAVVMIAVGVRFLPSFAAQRGRFDLIGAIASTLGMGALIFGIVNASEQGWTAPLTLASLVVGAFVLIGFVLIQWRARQPIMPLRLFRSAERSGAAVARLLRPARRHGSRRDSRQRGGDARHDRSNRPRRRDRDRRD